MQPTPYSPKKFSFDSKPYILVVEARFYEDIADAMLAGAKSALDANAATYEILTVPGALEIPAAIAYAVKSLDYDPLRRRFDGYVALGCVIKGETSHHAIVGGESARSLQELALRYVLAVGNGILTVDSREQAQARAAMDGENRGARAAEACLRMVEIKQQFRLSPKRRWVAKSG